MVVQAQSAGAILDSLRPVGYPRGERGLRRTANTYPSVIASIDGDDVGITTIKQHSPYAAEVYLMAVKPAHHRGVVDFAMLRISKPVLPSPVSSSCRSRRSVPLAATPTTTRPGRLPRLRVPAARGVPHLLGPLEPGPPTHQGGSAAIGGEPTWTVTVVERAPAGRRMPRRCQRRTSRTHAGGLRYASGRRPPGTRARA